MKWAERAQDERFQRSKIAFEQNSQHFRALNQIMWQVPILAMGLTGGLWYGAATLDNIDTFRAPLLFLAAAIDTSLIFILVRIRYIMDRYLDALEAFDPGSFVRAKGDRWCNKSHTVIYAFRAILVFAAVLSGIGGVLFAPSFKTVVELMWKQPSRSEGSRCSVAAYDRNARELAIRYESVSLEAVHSKILDLLPSSPAIVLDVGAGTGRDAAALASRGYVVTAVEPSRELRNIGRHVHSKSSITWVDDCLPHLTSIVAANSKFHLILLTAVWMHVAPDDRYAAFQTLSELLAPGGLIVFTGEVLGLLEKGLGCTLA